jgi:hypothetical protein
MTAKVDFTKQEWDVLLEGPTSAGLLVITAQPGGAIRETSRWERYTRKPVGSTDKTNCSTSSWPRDPRSDNTRYGSVDELREHALTHLRDAATVLDAKTSPEESDEYKKFVLNLSDKVARAHGEGSPGDDVISSAERSTIDDIAQALGAEIA